MLAWQYLEAMQLGPGGDEGLFIDGQGLRDEIYSWPRENPCFVDQVAGNEDWSDPRFFVDTNVPGYGLDAVEYLLFVDTTDNECPDHIDINADGTWAALGEEGVARVRAQMAAVCTAGVAQVGSELHASWRNDYLPSIQSRSGAEAQSGLLDDVRLAWRYIDVLVRRYKLCSPLELSNCYAEASGPVEHVTSSIALGAIHQNLVGFRDMFTGKDGPGFDALLDWEGDGALASAFRAELDEAVAAAEALESVDSIAPEDERVLALYQEVEDVMLILRSELTDTLGMEPPYEHENWD
jgi:predicted lipoprotein